ncbi:MAG: tyrosine-type recombinase/integrase, partial [Myxococcota bacterium]
MAPRVAPIDFVSEHLSAAQFLRRIRIELKVQRYRQRTIAMYVQVVARFFGTVHLQPKEVRREHVLAYLESLVDEGKSGPTISNALAALRCAFDKLAGRSVTEGLSTPRRRKRAPVVLSGTEVKRLLWAAPSLRDKTLIALMYASGLRVGEVVSLQWRDVDSDRGTLRVVDGKGQKDRYAPLGRSLAPLLRRWRSCCSESPYVFPAREQRHLSRRTAQRAVESAALMAG